MGSGSKWSLRCGNQGRNRHTCRVFPGEGLCASWCREEKPSKQAWPSGWKDIGRLIEAKVTRVYTFIGKLFQFGVQSLLGEKELTFLSLSPALSFLSFFFLFISLISHSFLKPAIPQALKSQPLTSALLRTGPGSVGCKHLSFERNFFNYIVKMCF